ncbi:MAG: prenyltransferase/squalene oxidase repeat-containing protein [Gemmataceae bacterium]
MPADYLRDLNEQLALRVARLSDEVRQRTAAYTLGKQNADGGWSGREGDSDLYYTGFALRTLSVLEALTPQIAAKTGDFLKTQLAGQASVVDFFSLLYSALLVQVSGGPDVFADAPSDWPERVAQLLDSFRTSDGGYNKSPGASSASTYHTFLVGLCYQLLGRTFPNSAEVIAVARRRRREDGGFVEIDPMRRSGTNPTAAAVGILQLTLGTDLPEDEMRPVIDFLSHMPSMEGGIRANDRVPLADLLSTFTGAWTLHQLDALEVVDSKQIYAYARSLEEPAGGFKGGLWDEQADVEYTFYGLGAMALTR